MDEDIVRLTDTKAGSLELKLAAAEVTDEMMAELSGYEWVHLAGCTLERVPGKQNWVDQTGGLPQYICEIARSIHREKGVPVGRAIALAVGAVQRWARGQGDVNADTRAKAAAALASWEAKRARAKADNVAKG